jgi:arsenate reductase (thioredoxin)
MTTEAPRILFLCTHNSARSQMAEALLRRHGGHRYQACSAGLEPTAVHPLTRRVLEEVGLDTHDLQAKGISAFLGKVPVKLAIVVCAQEDSCPRVYPFANRTLYWPFDDPAAASGTPDEQLAVFRRVRDEIADRVRRFVLEGV